MDRKIIHDKMDDSYKICCSYIKAAKMVPGSLCLVSERAKATTVATSTWNSPGWLLLQEWDQLSHFKVWKCCATSPGFNLRYSFQGFKKQNRDAWSIYFRGIAEVTDFFFYVSYNLRLSRPVFLLRNSPKYSGFWLGHWPTWSACVHALTKHNYS